MVYYHTSANIKMLRNILIDYGAASEVSPFEYMKTYMDKCPETIEDAKINWIARCFLSIQKHGQLIKPIASHLSEELSDEEQDYFMILFHAVIFLIQPKDMQYLYKCLFNLSKPLLNTFTKFLGNNEVLTYITHVAQSHYDTNYITNQIIAPLFTWQPYISEMGHSYGEYVQKIENRKIKPKTVPIQPNVLNRKTKESSSVPLPNSRTLLPATPPNSLRCKPPKKMLTKDVIDEKLKQVHEKNKQKATFLLNDAKSNDNHLTQPKSEKYYRRLSAIRDEIESETSKPLPKPKQIFFMKHNPPRIKETAATLKRMNKRVQLTEQDEVQWLTDLLKSCKGAGKVEALQEYDRQETEKERVFDKERKHLEGQISHEEALIAKKKVLEDNRKKYEEFLKEKQSWEEEIETWKTTEMEKNRKFIEKSSMNELNLLQARNEMTVKKKATVEKLKRELQVMLEKAMKAKHEELEQRINMIKEIKILSMIAKKTKGPKIIDLTESSGFGFLCEMSMAELQERLSEMKIEFNDELEQKRKVIKEENMAAKQDLEQAQSYIKDFMSEHAYLRKRNKKITKTAPNIAPNKDINNLKKILEEKKKLRMQLT